MFDQPPSDHLKLLCLDPGTARAGVLFASIPGPPEGIKPDEYIPDRIHFYGELMLKKDVTADYIARSIKEVHGPTKFWTFLIDKMGSIAKPGTFDITIRENLSRAFAKHGLVSQNSGSDFELSNPDVAGRELMLKAWLSADPPVVRVHRNMVHLSRQMDSFYRKQTDPTKRPESGKVESELIDCAEYIAAHFEGGLFWHSPEPYTPEEADEEADMRALLSDFESAGWDCEEALALAKIRLKIPGWEHVDPFSARRRKAGVSFGTFGKAE
jgi:hypothetical protein